MAHTVLKNHSVIRVTQSFRDKSKLHTLSKGIQKQHSSIASAIANSHDTFAIEAAVSVNIRECEC